MRTVSLTIALLLLGTMPALAQDANADALKKLSGELAKLIKEADKDGNGAINRAEYGPFEAAVRKMGAALLNEIDPSIAKKKAEKDLKKYDTDGDGALDEKETKAMADAKLLKDIQAFDWDEDGKLSEREKTAMQWAEEGRLDANFRNHDTEKKGELSEAKLATLLGQISKLAKKAKP